jgi:hypothetical protein
MTSFPNPRLRMQIQYVGSGRVEKDLLLTTGSTNTGSQSPVIVDTT